MHDKYRVTSDKEYIAEVNGDGRYTTIDLWRDGKLARHLSVSGEYPDKEAFEKLIQDELDDPYAGVEAWVPQTVHFDLTETVSISFNAFEEDNLFDVAEALLETRFKDFLLSKFRESLHEDPYIEAAEAESGRYGTFLSDKQVVAYLTEKE